MFDLHDLPLPLPLPPSAPSYVSVLANDLAAQDVTPISSYITIIEGEDSMSTVITTKMDSVAEPPEVFSVSIADSSGGGEITGSDASTATLTVLKSDFSNGVFGFRGPEFSLSAAEQSPPELVIVRQEGLYGHVTVTWQVVSSGTGTLATSDFDQVTGSLVFAPTENEKVPTSEFVCVFPLSLYRPCNVHVVYLSDIESLALLVECYGEASICPVATVIL